MGAQLPCPPTSLDEPPSSWSGSWSHVAAPPHTGSPQPHAQSTEAQAAAPEGSPDSLLFRARPPGGLRLEPHRPASRGRRGSGGVVLCLRAVCDSPSPAQLTFKSTNPWDSAWPGPALRTEAPPLGGAGQRGRSAEARGSGAAPPSPGRLGGAQPHTRSPRERGCSPHRPHPQAAREGRNLGLTASPRNVPIIHSIGYSPRLCPGLASR